MTPMSTARRGLGVAVVDDKIYVMGGQDENGKYLSDTHSHMLLAT